MVHRAILGSYERFLALLIEHFAGAFPVWLAPVQVKLLPISDRHQAYARSVADTLRTDEIRTEADDRSESIGKKIREAELQKIPFMLIIGDKESEKEGVTPRLRSGKNLPFATEGEFIDRILEECKQRR